MSGYRLSLSSRTRTDSLNNIQNTVNADLGSDCSLGEKFRMHLVQNGYEAGDDRVVVLDETLRNDFDWKEMERQYLDVIAHQEMSHTVGLGYVIVDEREALIDLMHHVDTALLLHIRKAIGLFIVGFKQILYSEMDAVQKF